MNTLYKVFENLPILSEIAALASEQEHLNLFDDVQRDVEILRVLLLLIIEPSTHNTDPSLLSVLEKYRHNELRVRWQQT